MFAVQQLTLDYGVKYNNESLDVIFPHAMQHPVHFEALFCLLRALNMKARGANPTEDRLFLYHHGKALVLLRQRLLSASPLEDDTMISTATLLVVDVSP